MKAARVKRSRDKNTARNASKSNDEIYAGEPKRCSRCKEKKPRSSFSRRNGSKDGLQVNCKSCLTAANAKAKAANKAKNADVPLEQLHVGNKACNSPECKGKVYAKSNFYRESRNADGLKHMCKDCTDSRKNMRVATVIAPERVDLKKTDGEFKCLQCGGDMDPDDMEQAHKSRNLAWRRSNGKRATMANHQNLKTLREDVKNCDQLCCACHLENTLAEEEEMKSYTPAAIRTRQARQPKYDYVLMRKLQIGCCQHPGCTKTVTRETKRIFHWDHLVPADKVATIADMCADWRYTIADIEAEIAKCQLLCVMHHRKRTREEGHDGRGKKRRQRAPGDEQKHAKQEDDNVSQQTVISLGSTDDNNLQSVRRDWRKQSHPRRWNLQAWLKKVNLLSFSDDDQSDVED